MTPPARYQDCSRTILEQLAQATPLLHLDWHEMTDGILRDLLVDFNIAHSTIFAINTLAETILSLGNPFPENLFQTIQRPELTTRPRRSWLVKSEMPSA